MSKPILFLMLFICLAANAQEINPIQTPKNYVVPAFPIIYFSYDGEGNQIERKFQWTTKNNARWLGYE